MSTEINYLKGDATAPAGSGKKMLVHICNDIGGWEKGFVLAISKRWKAPEQAYRNWYANKENFALGEIQVVPVEENLSVVNMIGQKGIEKSPQGPPIRYQAVETCLLKTAEQATKQSASVHMPRIGCGLAGGTWSEIEPILQRTLIANGISVYVYDF